jgi:hypothetical protein
MAAIGLLLKEFCDKKICFCDKELFNKKNDCKKNLKGVEREKLGSILVK